MKKDTLLTNEKELKELIKIIKKRQKHKYYEISIKKLNTFGSLIFKMTEEELKGRQDREKELIEEFEHLIKEQYRYHVIDEVSRDIILEELNKLKEKKE